MGGKKNNWDLFSFYLTKRKQRRYHRDICCKNKNTVGKSHGGTDLDRGSMDRKQRAGNALVFETLENELSLMKIISDNEALHSEKVRKLIR